MAFKLKEKLSWRNLIFIGVILVLLIPQTRIPIQRAFHKVLATVRNPSAIDANDREKLTPFDYKLATIDGTLFEAPIGKGRVTFISYWATWCPPCIAELPSIEALYADYGDKVDFILISQEKPERIRKFLNKKNSVLPAVNPRMKTPETLFERSIPTNYVIDKNGTIVVKKKGAANWNSDSVRTLLDTLLSE